MVQPALMIGFQTDFTPSVWNFCRWNAEVPPRETSPAARSEEKWLFGRLPFVSEMVYNRAHTVLKSPWNLEEVLEKSLNFCASTWKVLEFSSTLNVVAWREFFLLFGCPRQNINHSSVNLMVIYINCSMFYAIIKLSILFKAIELKNVKKLVKQTVQAFKCY